MSSCRSISHLASSVCSFEVYSSLIREEYTTTYMSFHFFSLSFNCASITVVVNHFANHFRHLFAARCAFVSSGVICPARILSRSWSRSFEVDILSKIEKSYLFYVHAVLVCFFAGNSNLFLSVIAFSKFSIKVFIRFSRFFLAALDRLCFDFVGFICHSMVGFFLLEGPLC